jgi:hypothetical protein
MAQMREQEISEIRTENPRALRSRRLENLRRLGKTP